jgi:MFS family permease
MMLSDGVVIISCILMARTLGMANLCFSRLVVGISCGISSSIIPPYLISLAPLEWRGLIGSLHQLFITIGVGFSFHLGQRLS